MPFFNSAQLAEIDAKRHGAGDHPYADAYDYIVSLITDADGAPIPGVAPGVWQWFQGAAQINRGIGPFSEFIRAYTNAQHQIRTGSALGSGDIQAASNSIAEAVTQEILDTGNLPTLLSIGNHDAAETARAIFAGNTAGWSGNLLFPALGEDSFFRSTLVEHPERGDTYDFLAAVQSARESGLAISASNLPAMIGQIISLIGGSAATIDPGMLIQLALDAYAFYTTSYNVLVTTLDYGTVLDKVQSASVINGTGDNDIINAFDLDDVIFSSAQSDIIDGGSGSDRVTYIPTGAVTVTVQDFGGTALSVGQVYKGVLDTDSLFNIEAISGSNDSDQFILNDVSSRLTALDLDGLQGDDDVLTINIPPSSGAVRYVYDFSTLNFGGSFGATFENFETIVMGGAISDGLALTDAAFNKFSGMKYFDFGLSGSAVNDAGERMVDTVDASALSGAVTVSLANPEDSTLMGAGGGTIHFRNAEAVTGTAFADTLTGGPAGQNDAQGIVLRGGAGNDTLTGGSGVDRLDGGADQDTIRADNDSVGDIVFGGSGADRIYIGSQDTVEDPDAGDLIYFRKQSGSEPVLLKGASRSASSGGAGLTGTYHDNYSDLTYNYNEASKVLIVSAGSSSVTINNFTNGDAGINLKIRAATPVPSINDTNKPPTGTDPLVLDLNGDGVKLTPIDGAPVYFDLNQDGLADRVGWVDANDGLLARDVNGDGRITGLNELFGTHDTDGFTVLSDYDSNHDGVINASDDIWSTLKVWRDADVDGDTDAGELQSLSYYGITSISLSAQPVDHVSNNNLLAFSGSYSLANGSTREIAAAFLQMSAATATESGDADYPDAVYTLPELTIAGIAGTLRGAAAADPTLLGEIQDLVANARTLDSTDFRDAFTNILLRWAGVDGIDPDSSGAYANAQHVAFLQNTGVVSPFLRQADGTLIGGASSPDFGPLIEDAFDKAVNDLLFRFATQLATSESLLGIDANATTTGWFAGLYNGTVYRADRDFFYTSGKEIGYGVGVAATQAADPLKYLEAVAPLARGLEQPQSPFGYGYDWNAVESDFGAGLQLGGVTDAALIEFATDRLHGVDHPIQIGTSGDDYLSAAADKPTTFMGGQGDDTLNGGNLADLYEYSLGDGHDTINETDDNQDVAPRDRPIDRLLLVGINRADVGIAVSAGNSDDLVLTFADGGTMTLAGQLAGRGIEEIVFANGDRATAGDLAALSLGVAPSDDPDTITGTRFDDVLNGLGGDDHIDGGNGNDRITGGTGDDILVGNSGDDTYVYTAGDGNDVIDIQRNDAPSAFTNSIADFEALELHGISPDDVTIRQNGVGYGITYLIGGEQPGSITVLGADNDIGIDEVRFDDGTVWAPYQIQRKMISDGATDGDDLIVGTDAPWFSDGSFGGMDNLAGGKGDDILEGLTGRDTYRYRLGDGNDTIIDFNDQYFQNKLVFDDLSRSDLTFSRTGDGGKDLLITVNRPEGGSVLVNNGFGVGALTDNSDYYRALSEIDFADGSILSIVDLAVEIASVMATEGDDTIIGLEGIDTINGLGGNDIILDTAGAGTVDGGDGDDVISAYDSVVTGGRGNDEIQYAAKIIYRAGDGDDVVDPSEHINIELAGIAPGDVTYAFADDRASLIIQIGGADPGSIKLTNIFQSPAAHITFGDGSTITSDGIAGILAPTTGTSGNDTILGVAGYDDTIAGLGGDDNLSGAMGNDTYVYNPGDGDDTIHDGGSAYERDVIQLHGIATADVTITRDGDDAVLTFDIPEQGSIRLTDQFLGGNIERIWFDDGTRWTQDELIRQTTAFGQDDILAATNMDDSIEGTSLSETIEGGAGDDVVDSGGGHDVIIFNPSDGHDKIEGLSDLSTIKLGVNPDDVTVVSNISAGSAGGFAYYFLINSTGDTIVMDQNMRTPFVEFADGTRWSPDELQARIVTYGSTGSDFIDGHFGDASDTYDLKGGSNDVIRPWGGSDTFRYHAGDGFLTIDQTYSAEQGNQDPDLDTLELHGIDPANVIVSLEHAYHDWGGDDVTHTNPLDLVFRFAGQDGAVIVKQAIHEQWAPDGTTGIEQVRFDDGTVWNATDIVAKAGVYGSDNADILFSSDVGSGIIRGGGGDDRIFEVSATDEVHWATGDGNDRISRIAGPGTLVLDDVNPGGATFVRNGEDLLVTVGGETITIVGQMGPTYSYVDTLPDGTQTTVFEEGGLAAIKFADGSQVTRQQLYESLPQTGSSWSDYLQGTRWADTMSGLDGDDQLAGKEGNDTLNGGDGSDTLLGGDGDDLLTGGLGDDLLNGGRGSDTYEWSVGDGNDQIVDKGGRYDGTDTLNLHGVTADDIELARLETSTTDSPYDALRITIKSTGETITIDSQYLVDSLAGQFLSQFDGQRDGWVDSGGGGGPLGIMSVEDGGDSGGAGPTQTYSMTDIVRSIEHIVLDDGTAIDPFSASIARLVEGTEFDDQLNGTAEGETFIGGQGFDTINGYGGADVAVYSGNAADYWISRNPDGSLTVNDKSGIEGDDTLTGIETLRFSDGDLAVSAVPALGTEANDIIVGSTRDDTLYGFGGDDEFTAGAGDDFADGGDGTDQARYLGSSTDFLVSFDQYGSLSVIDRTGAEGSDLYQNVESVYFAGDNVTIEVADLPPGGTPGDDVMTGTAAADVLFGFDGNDTLSGGDGDDILAGGNGDDTIDGDNGNDQARFDGASTDYQMGIQPDGTIVVLDTWNNGGRDVLTGVESLYFAGDDRTIAITELPALGTAGADTISGTDGSDMLFGLAGDDVITSGAGGDLVDGGDGDDQVNFAGSSTDYTISREQDGSISAWSPGGYDQLRNIETLHFAGDDVTLQVADLPPLGTDGDDVITGTNRAENLYGNDGDDTLVGLAGDDYLEGGNGDDILDGGAGADFLYGGDGVDTARFAGAIASYSLTTNGGLVTITDNDPSIDGDEGSDMLLQVEQAQFKDDSVSLALPIILDLNGNGVSLVDRAQSAASFDWNGDGVADRTGWVGAGDAFLALDRNHDGRIDSASELSFANDKPGAKSDLDGLSAFDSNGDGKLSSADTAFADFRIWQDSNGDGVSDASELKTLTDAGIAAIDLAGTAVNQSWGWDANITINAGTFERADGSVGQFADAGLNYKPSATPLAAEPDMDFTGSEHWHLPRDLVSCLGPPRLPIPISSLWDPERANWDFDHLRAAASFSEKLAAFIPESASDWSRRNDNEPIDDTWFASYRRSDSTPLTQSGPSIF